MTPFRNAVYRHLAYALCLAQVCATTTPQPDVRGILDDVLKHTASVNTLSYTLVYKERVYESGKMRTGSSFIKYQRSPARIYMKTQNGTEVLWGPDLNDSNALVHPSSFPYFNLSLDPDGYWMRKNQHHGIKDLGFDSFSRLLKASMQSASDDFNSRFVYKGEHIFNGNTCMEIDVLDPGFHYQPYTVKTGETILSIARAQALNELLILKHNVQASSYTDVKNGDVLMLPSSYAPRVTVFIDENTKLPAILRMEDEKGLFEEYVYSNIRVNPAFDPKEFSKDYKEYKF